MATIWLLLLTARRAGTVENNCGRVTVLNGTECCVRCVVCGVEREGDAEKGVGVSRTNSV